MERALGCESGVTGPSLAELACDLEEILKSAYAYLKNVCLGPTTGQTYSRCWGYINLGTRLHQRECP